MSREAMQIALNALESDPISHVGLVSRKQAITALRQALETEQEPLYWSVADGWVTAEQGLVREWVGLTDEEISDLWCKVSNTDFVTIDTHEFARAIEAKLKEKNI